MIYVWLLLQATHEKKQYKETNLALLSFKQNFSVPVH